MSSLPGELIAGIGDSASSEDQAAAEHQGTQDHRRSLAWRVTLDSLSGQRFVATGLDRSAVRRRQRSPKQHRCSLLLVGSMPQR